jgi:hypothetical protein
MAHEIKLECFSFVILNKEKEQVDLNTFFEGTDFIDFFRNWVRYLDGQTFEHGSSKKSMQLDFSSLRLNSGARIARGIVHGGYFGVGGAQKNLDTLVTEFRKTPRHTDETPFYYLLHAPLNKKRGLLFIQGLGSKTISELFKWRLKSYFRDQYKGHTLNIEYYISKRAVRQFLASNEVKSLVLRRYLLPADIADQVDGYNRDDFKVELIIANKKGNLFTESKITRFVNDQNTKFFTMPALDDLGFDGNHETLLQVKNGDSTRLINLNDIYSFKPQYFVDNTVQRDADYNPIFESIDAYAQNFLVELEQEESENS